MNCSIDGCTSCPQSYSLLIRLGHQNHRMFLSLQDWKAYKSTALRFDANLILVGRAVDRHIGPNIANVFLALNMGS